MRAQEVAMAVTTVLNVVGMTCGHCEAAVRSELAALPGVTDVRVELATGSVTLTSEAPLDADAVATAVDEAGYALAAAGQ
jgi:copper chaperone CopZ